MRFKEATFHQAKLFQPEQDPHDRVVELIEEAQQMSLNSDRLDMYEAAIRELAYLYTIHKYDDGDNPETIAESLGEMVLMG